MFFRPKIKVKRLYDVKLPYRATKFACGSDFYIPTRTMEYIKNFENQNVQIDKDGIRIPPHGKILIPSGLLLSFNKKKYAFELGNKSGIASKQELMVGAYLIDGDYENELFFNIINVSDDWQIIKFGEKIIQGYLIPAYYGEFVEVFDISKMYKGKKTRFGGFGSTGLK